MASFSPSEQLIAQERGLGVFKDGIRIVTKERNSEKVDGDEGERWLSCALRFSLRTATLSWEQSQPLSTGVCGARGKHSY